MVSARPSVGILLVLCCAPAFFGLIEKGLAEALLFGFLSGGLIATSIVVHEVGHLFFCRFANGVEPRVILLNGIGGIAVTEGQYSDGKSAVIFALGGPLFSLCCGALFTAGWLMTSGGISLALGFAALANAALLLTNLLPLAPTDGYMIARGLFWQHYGDRRRGEVQALILGNIVLSFIGIGVAFLLYLSPLIGGLVLALTGYFAIQHFLFARREARVEEASTST